MSFYSAPIKNVNFEQNEFSDLTKYYAERFSLLKTKIMHDIIPKVENNIVTQKMLVFCDDIIVYSI